MAVSLLAVPFGWIAYAVILCLLVSVSAIDWRSRRIPNALVLALVVLRMIMLAVDLLFGQGIYAVTILFCSLLNALFVSILLIVAKLIVDKTTEKDSLGWGDVKLAAAGALFLTPFQTFFALCIACVAGLVLALYFKLVHEDPTFPFGPALCLGIAIAILA